MNESRTQLMLFDLDARQRAVGAFGATAPPLAGLADSLTRDLESLLQATLPIPDQKARLTRIGGRCPTHGTLLEFDPWSPSTHHCTLCQRDYAGPEHNDWWAMGAQLWTAERAVHAAALYAVRGDERHAALSSRILGELAARYTRWPNRDNVLGPSRPFFSTYLESIWLLNICHALALLERAGAPNIGNTGDSVRGELLAPSVALIGSYHEGLSNRQVWNEVAILSALRLLGDHQAFVKRVQTPDGFPVLLQRGILGDGSWYEGENYHLFAHRGLWYGVELLRAAGMPVNDALDRRFRAGFLTPFVGLLPDDTFPSRRDSQYAVSVRQWRIAEWCELGYAHARDKRLAGVLTRLYRKDAMLSPRQTPLGSQELHRAAASQHNPGSHNPGEFRSSQSLARSRSTADAERNAPPSPLTRADLSWRALLMASAIAPDDEPWRIASDCLPAQGLAILRRDRARSYVALEGGHTGGGHGHPDALALTLQTAADRWLEDPGTGSYVSPSLHWYRSTIAHAAPLVNGASQTPNAVALLAFEDRGGAGWIWKRAHGIAPDLTVDRTIVVGDGYLIDLLEWWPHRVSKDAMPSDLAREMTIALPICGAATVYPIPAWTAAVGTGAGGLEDGFDFLSNVECVSAPSPVLLHPSPSHASPLRDTSLHDNARHVAAHHASVWYASNLPVTLWRATALGAPGHPHTQRHWLTAEGTSGCIAGVWSWSDCGAPIPVQQVQVEFAEAPAVHVTTAHLTTPELTMAHVTTAHVTTVHVTTVDGTRATHRRAPHGWHVDLVAGSAKSSIDLEGLVETSQTPSPALPTERNAPLVISLVHGPQHVRLGEANYVRTELSWRDAGAPTAHVQLLATATTLIIDVGVFTGPIVGQAERRENPLDNEHDDINADGLQLYLRPIGSDCWSWAALIVPVGLGSPRLTPLLPGQFLAPAIECQVTAAGWEMRLTWNREELPTDVHGALAFALVVNERSPDRERRRGQLVLGGGGSFGYLRGSRHDPHDAVIVRLPQ